MKTNSRVLATLLAMILMINMLPIAAMAAELSENGMSNIVFTEEYTAGQFSDVDESRWYGEGGQKVISTACKLGLMKGSGDGFLPSADVSLAEAVTMAARLHNLYCGSPVTFEQGFPWYQVYIDYAIELGIIRSEDFQGFGIGTDYTRAATRAEMAYIFSNALPDEELAAINNIEAIPDVNWSYGNANSIYQLYRAGILTGDETGTFHPDTSIDRASAAAILARVALPEMRKTFSLEEPGVLLWSEVYTKGMRADTTEDLEDIYTCAVMNRIDSFEVKTTQEVLEEFYNGGVLYDFNVSRVYYEYGGYDSELLRISITYTIFGEVEALAVAADAASRASEEAIAYHAKLEKIKSSIITAGMTDREKCKAIHDYMIRNYNYDQNLMDDSYSFSGLLDNGVGVCQAYMEMFYLLAARAGLYCEMMTGLADGGSGTYEPHGWNIVFLDGAWYHIDVTFDDPIGGGWKIYYDYFLITSDDISADHTW